jgi:tRNA threonylcarbamoyl adenosine modification protein YeaZ
MFNKNYLIIDTATAPCSISLLVGGNLTSIILEHSSQTKAIIPVIESLLNSNNFYLKDLDAIAICIGPGSYTGTRIGVMTAKTLSFGSNIPLIPFSTFDLFEENKPYAALDARCNRCYVKDINGIISLVNHKDLENILDPVHTIDTKPFAELNLKKTNKNIKIFLKLLPSLEAISHENLVLDYPTIENNT